MSQGAAELRGGVLRLLDSPIRFMEGADGRGRAAALPALVPVAFNAALLAGINALGTSRTTVIGPDGDAVAAQTMPAELLIPVAVVVGLIAFAVRAGAVAGIDALVAQSGKGRRIVELARLAYCTQVLWAVPAYAAMWWMYDPPPIVVSGQGLPARKPGPGEALAGGWRNTNPPFTPLNCAAEISIIATDDCPAVLLRQPKQLSQAAT